MSPTENIRKSSSDISFETTKSPMSITHLCDSDMESQGSSQDSLQLSSDMDPDVSIAAQVLGDLKNTASQTHRFETDLSSSNKIHRPLKSSKTHSLDTQKINPTKLPETADIPLKSESNLSSDSVSSIKENISHTDNSNDNILRQKRSLDKKHTKTSDVSNFSVTTFTQNLTKNISDSERIQSIMYCCRWIEYSIQVITQQTSILKALLNPLSNSFDSSIIITQRTKIAFKVKKEVVETLRKVLGVLSQHGGRCLPESLRSIVKKLILSLPQRWACIHHSFSIPLTKSSADSSPVLAPASPDFLSTPSGVESLIRQIMAICRDTEATLKKLHIIFRSLYSAHKSLNGNSISTSMSPPPQIDANFSKQDSSMSDLSIESNAEPKNMLPTPEKHSSFLHSFISTHNQGSPISISDIPHPRASSGINYHDDSSRKRTKIVS